MTFYNIFTSTYTSLLVERFEASPKRISGAVHLTGIQPYEDKSISFADEKGKVNEWSQQCEMEPINNVTHLLGIAMSIFEVLVR